MSALVSADWRKVADLVNGPVWSRGARHRELARVFDEGAPPQLPRGSYQGILSGAFHPIVDALGDATKAIWMPWVGKHLEPDEGRGWNLLRPGTERVLHRLLGETPTVQCGRLVAGYEFGYRVGDSALPGSPSVGRIEYADVDTNPAFLRRMHDEVVEVARGVVLGRLVDSRPEGPRITAWFALRGPVTAPRMEERAS